MNFGKEVRKALIDADLRPADLAKQMAVSAPYISMILNGQKRPNTALLDALAELNCITEGIEVAYCETLGTVDVSGLQAHHVQAILRMRNGYRNGAP